MKKLMKKLAMNSLATVLLVIATVGVIGPTCFMGFYQPELPEE
ncbi:cyclic lactone autoinducer peptide [Acetohalobium arabaticum]|uniref:Cyclic lactone autoinducer peptide n=1 Tax=Acetohalobium arabaticum (strain ATCC 49924 / DSM 5501 / Z-7288) TaxID=574087 RepID=D9QSG9_ACEAZ|nr:cyclic lactone autoinducer peptide [Acetohalobium arabaticum]ADL13432.1 hypothetical protein Acear_1931 [Acetohalobium arabaticum DSM 5501]